MIVQFIFALLLPICLALNSSKTIQRDPNFNIDCRKTPHLFIDALAKSPKNMLFIFFNKTYLAVSEVQKDNNLVTKKIVETKTVIPRLSRGHIESAFTYENITYFLSNFTDMWSYDHKKKVIDGPYERETKFSCLNNSYQIDSILTVQRSKSSAHMLIYHTEDGKKFLTFCDIITGQVVEKYQRPYGTDATEVVWNHSDRFEGINTLGYFFSYFLITTYLGNLRYVPLNQPYYDNQLLLDCPQEFCINGKIDAIVSTPSGRTYLLRGKYFWQFPTIDIKKLKFNYDSVKLISDYWSKLPSNIDSAFCDTHWIYFFKNEKFWKYDIRKNATKEPIIVSDIATEFPQIPSKVDAVWFNKRDKQIYFVKGNQYFIFETRTKAIVEKGEIIPVLNNKNRFPNFLEINAIHEDSNGNIYIFSDNYYFLANLTALKSSHTLIAYLSQESLFSCQRSYNYSAISIYKSFNGFRLSLLKYKPLNISFAPIANDSTTTELTATKVSNKLITNNELQFEDLVMKWNQSVFSFVTSEEKIPVWLTVFVVFTFLFIIVTSIVALLIILRQLNKI